MAESLAQRITTEMAKAAVIDRTSAHAAFLRALEILEAERLLCPLATAMLRDLRAAPLPSSPAAKAKE